MARNSTMKAVSIDRYGSPDVLRIVDAPTPKPSEGEVLVRVTASTVNRTDTATIRAHPFFARAMTGWLRPNFTTTGMEFAGVIEAIGNGVTEFQVGDAVFGMEPDAFGGHSEYVCCSASGSIGPVPEGLPPHQALVGEGAWYASSTVDALKPGGTILIYGASGAIGTAAVQLAKVAGAEVTAVVGTRHMRLAQELGADFVVNYETQDFTAIERRFDMVFDAVGKTSYFECRKLLKPEGVYSATDLGPWWSNIWLGLWFALTGSKRVRIPYPKDAAGFVRRLSVLMKDGRYRGVFDSRFPMEDVAAAFRYVEAGQKTGIVVLEIAQQ